MGTYRCRSAWTCLSDDEMMAKASGNSGRWFASSQICRPLPPWRLALTNYPVELRGVKSGRWGETARLPNSWESVWNRFRHWNAQSVRLAEACPFLPTCCCIPQSTREMASGDFQRYSSFWSQILRHEGKCLMEQINKSNLSDWFSRSDWNVQSKKNRRQWVAAWSWQHYVISANDNWSYPWG